MKKKILAITSGYIHPKIWARKSLIRFLKSNDAYEIVTAGSIEALKRLHTESFDGVIIYLHRRKISDKALGSLKSYLNNGGGLLAMHSATASFKKCPEYFKLLGGRFVSHEKVMDFQIALGPGGSKIFKDINTFTIYDELYIHETYEGITVHLYGEANGVKEPVLWTKNVGSGKVCYLEPGHCGPTLVNPEMEKIIIQSLNWISSE